MKGTFSAAYLATLESSTGRRLSDHFDLIVGTSVGGIIALGIGLGSQAADQLDFCRRHAVELFPTKRSVFRNFRALLGPRYDASQLEELLKAYFGSNRLGDSRNRLVIPSFNPSQGNVHLFKTAHHVRFAQDYRSLAWEVARATSAAPTYFRAHRHALATDLVDGGLWANNPSMVALTEAIGILGYAPEQVAMLSVGTTRTELSMSMKTRVSGGAVAWGVAIAKDLFMHIQTIVAHNQSCHMLERGYYQRVDPSVRGMNIPLDDSASIPDLIACGEHAARHTLPVVGDTFLATPVVPFVPEHKLES